MFIQNPDHKLYTDVLEIKNQKLEIESAFRNPQSAIRLPLVSLPLVPLSVALKSDATGSILASSPALLLKEKGVDFVTNE